MGLFSLGKKEEKKEENIQAHVSTVERSINVKRKIESNNKEIEKLDKLIKDHEENKISKKNIILMAEQDIVEHNAKIDELTEKRKKFKTRNLELEHELDMYDSGTHDSQALTQDLGKINLNKLLLEVKKIPQLVEELQVKNKRIDELENQVQKHQKPSEKPKVEKKETKKSITIPKPKKEAPKTQISKKTTKKSSKKLLKGKVESNIKPKGKKEVKKK